MLESRVKLRLLDQMGLVAFNVEVEAVDGTVSLRGTLPDQDHRDIALRTAGHTKGVKKVLDILRVR
jgi:osmotically-inducible protein OsmY